MAGFINVPGSEFSVQLPGLYFAFNFNAQFFISLLAAGLTATGTDWLVREHPSFDGKYTIQHWLLPTLTAWVIGLVLFQQPTGFAWWVIFGVGGITLVLVLMAEYIVIDPNDALQIPATIGITALSFALLLILMISIRFNESRLFILVPTITIAAGLTSLRTLYLRLHGRWAYVQTVVIAIIIGQFSAALNYLPIDPISFGLFLLGLAYALTSMMGSFLEEKRWQQTIVEPTFVLFIIWGIAYFVS